MTNIGDCNSIKDNLERNACVTNHLNFFEYNIEGPTFRYLFVKNGGTDHMANHMWNKFKAKNNSILALWGHSDLSNQRILIKVISDWDMSKLPYDEIRKFDEEHPREEWA